MASKNEGLLLPLAGAPHSPQSDTSIGTGGGTALFLLFHMHRMLHVEQQPPMPPIHTVSSGEIASGVGQELLFLLWCPETKEALGFFGGGGS